METSELNLYHRIALSHPLFRRLSSQEKKGLKEFYLVQEYLKGETILFEGDSLDSLYLILEGRVVSICPSGGERKSLFTGDFWGLQTLKTPEALQSVFKAAEDSVVLRLRGEGFRRFIQEFPSAGAGLKPRKDSGGYHISGFPSLLWKELRQPGGKKREILHFEGRTSKKTFSLFLLIPAGLILLGLVLSGMSLWALLLSAAGVFLGLCELFLRQMTLYRVSDKTASKRFFNWRSLRRDQEELPLDQIKSIQINVKGILRHLLRIGDLTILTAGEGIVFRHIDRPGELQKKLMELRSHRSTISRGEEREELRDMVKERLSVTGPAQRRYSGTQSLPLSGKRPESVVFRKSAAVLLFQLFIPLSLLLLSILPSLILTGDTGQTFTLVLWALRLALLFRILWCSLDWWNDVYKIDLPYIWDIERKPFAREEQRTQTDLSGILNVRVSQKGLLKIILNYGDVHIEIPGNRGALQFFSVARPLKVQAEIFRFRDLLLQEKEEQRKQNSLKQFGEFAEIIKQVQDESSERAIRI